MNEIQTVGDALRTMAVVVQKRRADGIQKPVTWENWWPELKALAKAINYPFVYDGNEECWRDYFDGQNSPAEAIEEDMSYLD